MVSWIYGSGFPKSLNISKAIDKCNGDPNRLEKFTAWMRTTGMKARVADKIMGTATMAGHYFCKSQPAIPTAALWAKLRPHIDVEIPSWVDELVDRIEAEREVVGSKTTNKTVYQAIGEQNTSGEIDITAPATDEAKQWDGWGTALKPSCEFFTLARKPLSEKTVAANVLKWGTGGINIDGCRVHSEDAKEGRKRHGGGIVGNGSSFELPDSKGEQPAGRFPANLIHDGSQEVLDLFPETGKDSAARFFYFAKASKKDRDEGLEGFEAVHRVNGNKGTDQDYRVARGDRPQSAESGPRKNTHPTVKPTALMQYLCRLITPAGGTVLDPYMGSGSTGKAALREGFDFIGCELDADYFKIAKARIGAEQTGNTP